MIRSGNIILFSIPLLCGTLRAIPAVAAPNAVPPAVARAENEVGLQASGLHTQYHENISPLGDDESGYQPGLGLRISALRPLMPGWNPAFYAALDYDYSAGGIHYGGHYLFSQQPASETDSATFNRVEARLGMGYALPASVELIPFIAGGYQDWSRNIQGGSAGSTNEFYHTALLGGGLRLDVPLTPAFVASFDGELMALTDGGISDQAFNFNQGFGTTGEQRISLGLDDALLGRLHLAGSLFWQHFNYSGTKPAMADGYMLHEPLSVTIQFGATIGLAVSFY